MLQRQEYQNWVRILLASFFNLKGKIINFRDEEVKDGFNWLKKESNFVENISAASIKINENGIKLLKNLNKI